MVLDTRINTTIDNKQVAPSVAALIGGGFVTTWQSFGQDGSSYGIYGQRYDANGNTQGTEFRANTTTSNNQANPSVAALIDGGYVVIWRSDSQNGTGSSDIYGQRYDAVGTALGTEFRISNPADDNTFEASVAALTGGGFVVTWQSYDSVKDDFDIHGQRYDAAGNAQGAALSVTSSPTNSQESPSVAALTGGGFVVTWQSYVQDGSEWGIYGQSYDANGAAQGNEFLVNTETFDSQSIASVAALADGSFVVTWQSYQQDGGENGIYGQRYDASGVAQGNEFLVNTNTTSDQQFSSVTALTNGGFVVTWNSDDPNRPGYDIYGQRYDAGGNTQGTEFLISSNPVNSLYSSSVAGLFPNGGFVVTWTAFDSNGTEGIYGKHFDANGNESNWITNSLPTGAVTIDGTATEDQVLTANTSTITDVDGVGAFSYQWLRDGVAIGSANGNTYTLGDADVGKAISAQVGYTDGHGTLESLTSAATAAIANVNDVPTGAVTIDGTAAKGQILTVNTSTIADVDGVGAFSYQWLRDGVAIGSANGNTYTLGDADVGKAISAQVGYTDGHGTLESLTSAATAPVTGANDGVLLFSTPGNDILTGTSSDNDTVSYVNAPAGVTVSLDKDTQQNTIGAGMDTITNVENLIGSNFNDNLRGSFKTNTLDGGAGNDTLHSENGNDTLHGGDGNDVLYGGAGADTIDGGAGWDIAHYGDSTAVVNIDMALASQIGGIAQGDILTSIEVVTGSIYNDVISGNSARNNLRGGDGDDVLRGQDGNDVMSGQNGDDTLYGGTGNDDLYGNDGNDVLYGNDGKDVLYGGAGADTIDGGAGWDIAHYGDSTAAVNIDMALTTQIGGIAQGDILTSIEVVTGSIYNDVISGNSARNNLRGGDGDDVLRGQDGNDVMSGQNGDDTLYGGTGNDDLYGNDGNDVLYGNDGKDVLYGGAGADTIDGGAGWDIAHYGDSTAAVNIDMALTTQIGGIAQGDILTSIEVVTGSIYNDVISGNSARNNLRGGDGDDVLRGQDGNDVMSGQNGDDTLYGGTGNDDLYGNDGADRFVFEAISAFTGIDTVKDFKLSQNDALDISDLLSGYDPLSDAIEEFVQITDSGANSLVSVDTNGGGDNFVQIATLIGVTSLTNEETLETSGNLITV